MEVGVNAVKDRTITLYTGSARQNEHKRIGNCIKTATAKHAELLAPPTNLLADMWSFPPTSGCGRGRPQASHGVRFTDMTAVNGIPKHRTYPSALASDFVITSSSNT